ncbi:hypothetical protein D3C86_1035010 [compost metagenome]
MVLDCFGVGVETLHQQSNHFIVTVEDQCLIVEAHGVFTISQLQPFTGLLTTEHRRLERLDHTLQTEVVTERNTQRNGFVEDLDLRHFHWSIGQIQLQQLFQFTQRI